MKGELARIALGMACAMVGAGSIVAGCQQAREHPPPLPACEGPGCVEPPPVTGSGGVTGADSEIFDVLPDQRTIVTGQVMRISSVDFSSDVPFGEPAEIRADGAGGGEVTTQSDGMNPFELQNVELGQQVWFGVFPTNPATADAMPTIEPHDTRVAGAIELHVIAGSVLDQIYNVITSPTTRAQGAAHIVLHFVRDSDRTRPLSGVTVLAPSAEAVIYDAAGTFSDATGVTGPLGLVIIANFPASAVARNVSIAISEPISTSISVRVLADAVTSGEVALAF